VHWGSRRALMTWMTALIYVLSSCALISPGHCCSQHSHGEVDAHGDDDHLVAESPPDVAFSDLETLPNELVWSRMHCCGQGPHGEGQRIALHAASCQRSTEPSRPAPWLSASAEAAHGGPYSPNAHGLGTCPLSRASPRSPALESILTVSLLI
jgi:hypothetical protein